MARNPTHKRGALITGLVCAVWIVLAQRNPTLHYHFAPLIAAVVWPLSLRSKGRREKADAFTGGAGSLALTLLVTLVIQLAGTMDGPNFLHAGPAWPEAVLFAVLGAALGSRAAGRDKPGILGRLVDSSAAGK